MTDRPRVSVVVPTLEEAGNIGPLLERLDRSLADLPHEVIVVDDGSEDGTRREALQAHPAVHVVRRSDGDGLASAVVRGIELAHGEHVAVIDGDLQHPPETVRDLLRAAEWRGADLVVGSRYTGSGAAPGFARHRQLISWGARMLIRGLLPSTREAGLTDPTSGLFLFRRDRVRAGDLDPSGYKILLEVLEEGRFDRVEEVAYTFGARSAGDSNLSLESAWATFQHIVELASADRSNRRFAQFGLVGLLGVLVNLGLLALLTEVVGLHYLVSAGIAVEASILSNFAFNDAWTFRDLRRGSWLPRLWRFNVVSLLSLLVNLAVLSLLTEVMDVYYLVSEVAAIGVAFATNYHGNLSWTYLTVPEDAPTPKRPAWDAFIERARSLVDRTREKVRARARWDAGQEDEIP